MYSVQYLHILFTVRFSCSADGIEHFNICDEKHVSCRILIDTQFRVSLEVFDLKVGQF